MTFVTKLQSTEYMVLMQVKLLPHPLELVTSKLLVILTVTIQVVCYQTHSHYAPPPFFLLPTDLRVFGWLINSFLDVQ